VESEEEKKKEVEAKKDKIRKHTNKYYDVHTVRAIDNYKRMT